MANSLSKLFDALRKALPGGAGRNAPDLDVSTRMMEELEQPLPIPFLGQADEARQRSFVFAAIIGSIVLAALFTLGGVVKNREQSRFLGYMENIDTALQEAQNSVKLAPYGSPNDFARGRNATQVLTERIANIQENSLQPLGVDLTETVAGLQKLVAHTDAVVQREASLTSFARTTAEAHQLLALVVEATDQAHLIDEAASGSSNTPLYSHLREAAHRSSNLVLQFASSLGNAETNLRVLTIDLNDLARLSGYLTSGTPGVHVEPPSREIAVLLQKVADLSPQLINNRKNIEQAVDSFAFANRRALEANAVFSPAIKEVREKIDALRSNSTALLLYGAAGVMTLLSALCIALLQAVHSHAAQRAVAAARREQDDTDEAILRIMAELLPISEGDLTARAAVTEHVTGAIADRINMAAESLEKAIAAVKNATARAHTMMSTIHSQTSGAVEEFDDAAFQASDSRNVAELGSSLVGDAVQKMEEARERMQGVSKRVKRLGEVSQAITSIVDLIEEVTQKTSILALNTSLKAAEAGEEGQAFQVIAKEIRDLSDDARKALRQIAHNVQMIQGETHSVIQTVETVTQDVVEGSRLWEDARITLNNITTSSEQIEGMVKRFGAMAKEQAGQAASAADVMGDLAASMQQFRTSSATA